MQAQPTFYFNNPSTLEISPQVSNYACDIVMFGVGHQNNTRKIQVQDTKTNATKTLWTKIWDVPKYEGIIRRIDSFVLHCCSSNQCFLCNCLVAKMTDKQNVSGYISNT